MEWSDTPDQAAFRAEVRRFVAGRLPAHYRALAAKPRIRANDASYQWIGDRQAPPGSEPRAAADAWAAALAERGWICPAWPREYGGAGLSAWELFIYRQEMADASAPAVGGQGVTQLGPTLIVHGTEEQKRKYLTPILQGQVVWCQGYSEPGAGSDLASLQTRATRDGDEYVLRGQKIWTSNGHRADHIYVLARTDPNAPKHRGVSFLLLEHMRAAEGLIVRPLVNMGWDHHFNEVFFEDVRVPAHNLVGEENRGWYVGMTLLDYERGSLNSGYGDRIAVRDLVAFANSARGRTMSRLEQLPALRSRVAERAVESEVSHILGMRVTSIQAAGRIPNYEASASKLFSSETHQHVQRTGTQVFGLYSNLWDEESPHAPHGAVFTQGYVKTVPATIGGGTSEIQRNIIATRGLGLPRG